LFETGDAGDLRRCLMRLIEEPALIDCLRSGIPRMRTIQEDAEWTRDLYAFHLDNPDRQDRERGGRAGWIAWLLSAIRRIKRADFESA
jgi:hypothetical protein